MCVCGLAGQYECSLCRLQSYCSPVCQSADWIQHNKQCSGARQTGTADVGPVL